MDRRRFSGGLALGLASAWLPAQAQKNTARGAPAADWRAIERRVGGRLGVAVLDTADGRLDGQRLDERFPMCSTFKWLAAALVLERVDAGTERLDRHLRYGPDVLVAHSPVTKRHQAEGMSLGGLCEATVTESDNGAANLILDSVGGPAAITAFARRLGDTETRLDRAEPMLNEAAPGDPRDTTTPRAMVGSMRAAALGEALSPASRDRLVGWLVGATTGRQRLRAALPPGWRGGDKTGSGERGTTNDVAVFWPPGHRSPMVIAAYLTDSAATWDARQAALAAVGRVVVRQVGARHG
jgi:beta-lactamase class A